MPLKGIYSHCWSSCSLLSGSAAFSSSKSARSLNHMTVCVQHAPSSETFFFILGPFKTLSDALCLLIWQVMYFSSCVFLFFFRSLFAKSSVLSLGYEDNSNTLLNVWVLGCGYRSPSVMLSASRSMTLHQRLNPGIKDRPATHCQSLPPSPNMTVNLFRWANTTLFRLMIFGDNTLSEALGFQESPFP